MYTTFQSLIAWGGFDEEQEDENLLNALILTASAIIDNYTQKSFESDEETEVTFYRYRGYENSRFDGRNLYFFNWLAEAPSAVTDSPTVLYLPETGPPYYGMYLVDGTWAYPSVAVTGHWAYSKTAPYPVQQACLRLAKWLYNQKDTYNGAEAIVTPEGQVLIPTGLPNDVVQLLAPYRGVRLA